MPQQNRIITGLLMSLLLILLLSTTCWAVPSLISVEGRLSPPPPITFMTSSGGNIEIHIYDAPTGGSDVGGYTSSYAPLNRHMNADGSFHLNVILSEQNFLADNYWVGITINGIGATPITFPPQQIVAVPYAITARNAVGSLAHPGIIYAHSTNSAVFGTTYGDPFFAGIGGLSLALNGKGVWGNADDGRGVLGTGWRGVVGESTIGNGVMGITANSYGSGVYGTTNVASNEESPWLAAGGITGFASSERGGPGVQGLSSSETTAAVFGFANSYYGVLGKSEGANYAGIYGENSTPGSPGVLGQSANEEGGPAIIGKSQSAIAPGVLGWAKNYHGIVGSSEAGNRAGVSGSSNYPSSAGVSGRLLSPSGGQAAVKGYSESSNAAGVFGHGENYHGVEGQSMSPNHAGVLGSSNSTGGTGVLGLVNQPSGAGIGVVGINNDGGIGVYGSNIAAGNQASPFMVKTFYRENLAPSGSFIISIPNNTWIYGVLVSAYTADSRDNGVVLPGNYYAFSIDDDNNPHQANKWITVSYARNPDGSGNLTITNLMDRINGHNINIDGLAFYGPDPTNSW